MTALKKWMDANGKSDLEVAEAVGVVSRSQVNRLKNGASQPSFKAAAALEKLTKIPAGKLFQTPPEKGAA